MEGLRSKFSIPGIFVDLNGHATHRIDHCRGVRSGRGLHGVVVLILIRAHRLNP